MEQLKEEEEMSEEEAQKQVELNQHYHIKRVIQQYTLNELERYDTTKQKEKIDEDKVLM